MIFFFTGPATVLLQPHENLTYKRALALLVYVDDIYLPQGSWK